MPEPVTPDLEAPAADAMPDFDLLTRTEPITESFWMVLSPEGVQPAHRMLKSRKSAIRAAAKLAKRLPEQRFFVVYVAGQVHADGNYTPFLNTPYTRKNAPAGEEQALMGEGSAV